MKRESKQSNTRFVISLALFAAAFISAVAISFVSNKGAHYWVLTHNVAQGVQIKAADLAQTKASLGTNPAGYLSTKANPVGSITRRPLAFGEFISARSLSDDPSFLSTETISISVRSVDIPSTISIGEVVDIFQLHDSKNGEAPQNPERISMSAFVQSIDRKGNALGGEVGLTISVDRSEIPALLMATTSGRLVIVQTVG